MTWRAVDDVACVWWMMWHAVDDVACVWWMMWRAVDDVACVWWMTWRTTTDRPYRHQPHIQHAALQLLVITAAASSFAVAAVAAVIAVNQGLILVYCSAQHNHFLRDTVGGFCDKNGSY